MKGVPGTTVFIGEGPGRTADERIPVVIVRRTANAAVFTARHVYKKEE
jgi:hypothetical protein